MLLGSEPKIARVAEELLYIRGISKGRETDPKDKKLNPDLAVVANLRGGPIDFSMKCLTVEAPNRRTLCIPFNELASYPLFDNASS